MRRLKKHRRLSNGLRSSQFSDALLPNTSEGSINLLIQQLKEIIFEVDLLNAIEINAQLGIDIQKLFVELNKRRVSDSMFQFLIEFEAYFDQAYGDVDFKRTYNA